MSIPEEVNKSISNGDIHLSSVWSGLGAISQNLDEIMVRDREYIFKASVGTFIDSAELSEAAIQEREKGKGKEHE